MAEHELITWLSMQWSRVWMVLIMWLIKNWSRGYNALITWLRMHWSCGWSYTDDVTDQALITWLIIHWSRGYYALITGLHMQCSRNCRQWSRGYHALIMCLSCTEHVADQTLITWLIMHWSRGWSCTNHFVDHALIRGGSYTDHMTDHALITCLIMHCYAISAWSGTWSVHDQAREHCMISHVISAW